MKLQKIEIVHDFSQPVEQVFSWLSDHNNLSAIFAPFTVTRIKDGQTSVNGVGSVRKEHLGVMIFQPFNGGTRLHYTIVFKGVVPFLGPIVKMGLGQGVKRGLNKLATKIL